MTEVRVSNSVDLPAQPDDVWAFVCDFSGYGSWQPHIKAVEMLPNGDRRVLFTRGGTIVDRVVARDDAAMTYTYSVVPGTQEPGDNPPPGAPAGPPPGGPLSMAATFAVRPSHDGSEVEYTIEAQMPAEVAELARAGIASDIDGALAGLRSRFG